jgi:flagellar motor protein MotB
MRRRRSINVWPAFADLMTVLAVPGLFVAIALLYSPDGDEELRRVIAGLQQQLAELRSENQILGNRVSVAEGETARLEQTNEMIAREAAKNKEMFRAIQSVAELVDVIEDISGLEFSSDQSLDFGSAVASFELNETEAILSSENREKLLEFCKAISEALAYASRSGDGLARVFTIHVEGHTDSSTCPGDPYCNWRFSAERAVKFVSYMRRSDFCPGGRELNLRPIGYADSRPAFGSHEPTRRITLRVIPDYEEIISHGGYR